MKLIYSILLLFTHSFIFSQTWIDCNEMLITVDDFGSTLDFENQPLDCGCTGMEECTLVRIKLVETINGIEVPVNTTGIGFMPPLGNDSEPNQIAKDYIDLFDPYFANGCTEYQAAGFDHNYLISPVAPEGEEFHVLVCPGSEIGVRNGRFFLPPGDPTQILTKPTNVQATDGAASIDISFNSIIGKYYMVYRNSQNCNNAWVKVDGNSNWPQATANTMTIGHQQGGSYGTQYQYRVVASDFAFDPGTSATGIWSEPDLGHGGQLLEAYDSSNDCSLADNNDCSNDTTPPTCGDQNIIITGDNTLGYGIVDFKNHFSDLCDDDLSINGFNVNTGTELLDTDQVPCGETITFSMQAIDNQNNIIECDFFVTAECEMNEDQDSCIVESDFTSPYWKSYFGGSDEETIADIHVDDNSGIMYLIGHTRSTDFYSTNPVIGGTLDTLNTFVSAIAPDASLLWSTLISGWKQPYAIDLDDEGLLTLVGVTVLDQLFDSSLPGFDKTHNGGKDILILKMESDGSSLVYNSFFGGNGDDENIKPGDFKEDDLKVDFQGSKVFIFGETTSNDLDISANAIDNNPGEAFACVLDLSVSSSSLLYSTYFKNGDNGAIASILDDEMVIIADNAEGNYSQYISNNAIEEQYDGYAPLPILLKFDQNYNVVYGTYIGAARIELTSDLCDPSVVNGAPQDPNYYYYNLRVDNCGDIYWYSKCDGFRSPFFSSEFLLPAVSYVPEISSFPNQCSFSVRNPLLKINFSDEVDPFIEYMLFFGYHGFSGGADSDFDIDESHRVHMTSRGEAFFDLSNINLDFADQGKDNYFIFESDLSSVAIQTLGDAAAVPRPPIDIIAQNNKGYVFGGIQETLLSTSATWMDEEGNTNNILQQNYAGGLTDGFIDIIDNNELCDGCNTTLDTTECQNVVLSFDGVDDRVEALSPLSGNSNYTISLDFKCENQTGPGLYHRLVGFTDYQTEIAIKGNELSYYNGSSWRDVGVIVSDDIWHNVILVRDGLNYTLYLDGTLISTIGGPSTLNFNGNTLLGSAYSGTAEKYKGLIDNYQVMDYAVDDQNLCQFLEGNLSGNVLVYNFEDGVGSGDNTTNNTLTDLAGDDNNGNLFNFNLTGDQSNYLCVEVDVLLMECNTPPQCEEECSTTMVDLSTGVDFNDGTLLNVGDYDGGWVMISGPEPNLSYPLPGYVLNPNSAWSSQLDAQFISPFANTSNNESFPEPYTFERKFCVCDPTMITLNIQALFDNFMDIGLYDESGILIQQLINVQTNSVDNFQIPTPSVTTHQLGSGIYSIRAGLRNDAQASMGMAIEATLTGAGLLESACCSPFQYITGTVFNDLECNSLNNLDSDTGIQGATVSLCSPDGTEIANTTSDALGYYTFVDVIPGDYLVKQTPITDLTQTLGENGYTINVSPNVVIEEIDFGNCENDPSDCTPYIVCEFEDIIVDSCQFKVGDYLSQIEILDSCCVSTRFSNAPAGLSNHSLSILENGTLWGWGTNTFGQLGLGNTQFITEPILIDCGSWQSVSVGGSHSLAIKSDGTLWAAGSNLNGILGIQGITSSSTFVQVGTENDWDFVHCTGVASFGIKHDGTLWAWGRNFQSALGLGDDINREVPTRVGTSNDWKVVASDGANVGALGMKTDGTIWGWGFNNVDLLIPIALGAIAPTPIQILPDSGYKDLSCQGGSAFVIDASNKLWGWGVNMNGQMGIGMTSSREAFHQIGASIDWIDVEAGSKYMSVLNSNGEVYSVGRGVVGSIGNGLLNDKYNLTLSSVSDIISISTSSEGTFCLRNDFKLFAFGGNGFGVSLGIGMPQGAYPTPTEVIINSIPSNVTLDYTIEQNPTSGSIITEDTKVTLIAYTDENEIVDSCCFFIELCSDICEDDQIDPICITQNINLSLDQNGQATLTPDIIDNGSFDECSEVVLFIDQAIFTCNDVGVNEVTLTVTDASGNVSSCVAEVTIEDKIQPICMTKDITINLDDQGMVTIHPLDIDGGFNDNCPLGLGLEVSQLSFTCTDLGVNILDVTIMDTNGNSTNCSVVVTVLDTGDYCDPTCIFSCTEECSTDIVNLSTGIDPVTAAFLAIGDYDANWTLIGSPDPGIQVPRPAFVLNPNSVWDQLPGSQYISAYPNAENNATNIDDNTFYEFEKCFCVCEDVSDVSIDLSAYVDNNLEILLFDSDGLEIQSLLNITDETPGAFTGNPETTITTLNLANGIYCLRARLKNDGSQTMGMSIEANISGIGLIENQCCKSYNAITGVVFQDPNCDGIYSGESYLAIPEWEIQLCSGSTVVESILTDGFGYYSFNNIPPGDYTVKALNPDMNQASTPLINDVIIGDNEVIAVDFGFCDVDVCCFDNTTFNDIIGDGPKLLRYDCDAILKSPEEYDGCFETIVDWGDGIEDTYYGSYIVQHEYLANGEYEICTQTVQRDSDGAICNTLSECRSVCMTCDQECYDDYLYAIESYQYPNFNELGSINKDSDVFLDDTGLYTAYSKDNINGGTDILIYKDGILAHTMPNSIGTQVSEIQVHDDYIYLTGSFEGGDMLVTSSDGNNVILNNNCYQPEACLSDGYVIRFNMGFTLDWAFRLGQTWIDVVEDLIVISESEFAITGTTRLDADFDPNPGPEQETIAEPTHTIKSFVAKYSIDASQDLPVCDWVNTLYTIDAAVSNSFGLGITYDPVSEDFYCTGGYGSGTAYGNTSAMQLYSSTSISPLTGFSVPAGKIFGYVVSYDAQGNLLWSNSLGNTGIGGFRNNYGSDIEILNNSLFVGGLNTVAKYQLDGTLDPNLNINPIIEYGLDINEIAVSDDRVYLLGFVNDTYRNLAIQLPPGVGPQITSPLNMLFSVYDENLGYIKSLNPGGNGIDYGQGISVNSDQIAICGSTSSDIFLLNHPRQNLGDPQLPLLSERDFFVGLYECSCSQFDEGQESCCDGLTTQLKDDTSDYCCSISINNSQEFDISYITIDIDPASTSVFESGQLELNSDFLVLNSTATSLDIGHISGSIPQGPISSLVDFCLFSDNPSATGPIGYTISYIQIVNQQEQVACQDIVIGDCDQGELSSCASITNVSILCSEEKEAYYEVTLNVNNESGNEIEQLQLSGLPSGMSWSPCDIDPPFINTELDVSLDALQQGENIDICVRIYTNNPVTIVTNVLYAASFLDADGKTFCTLSVQELELIPCCDLCEDINIMISESSDCCYTISMNGLCATNNYQELNISAPDGVAIVNSNVTINTGQIQPWILCDTGNDDLCVTPRGDFFTDAAGANEITFCLSGNADGSQEMVFDFRNDKSDILCSKTEIVNCNGGCVPEGFKDPSLVTIGLVDQKFRLECDQPPLILDCPTFSEIFIKGRFDCSEECDAEVSTSVLYNGIEIKPEASDFQDGTWEIYLTDLIKNPGLYQIIVEGDCDGNKQQCTYSFEVTEDCFDCKCSKLNDDLSNLWSINNYGGCQIGISPNGLLECDEVASYSFNANIIDGPFTHNEEVLFNIPQSGMYVICMKVNRNGEDADCEDQICETYKLTCSSDGVNGLFCEIPSIENGDFSQGIQGSLHDNSKSFLPGWELSKGEAWYFESNGSGDTTSGYIQLAFRGGPEFDDAFMTSRIVNPDIIDGESNIVRIFHDVKSTSDYISYAASIITENDTIIISSGGSINYTHENIWESKMIAFPISDDILSKIEEGAAQIGISTCNIDCDTQSSADEISFDNICVEVEKMTVSTYDQNNSDGIRIYPNPNRGLFYIEFDDPNQYINITILDVVGKVIYEDTKLKNLMQLNLESFTSGVYILKAKTLKGEHHNLKFIKIR